MASDALAKGWAKALGVDRKQFDMFFEKMMDGFAYHKIVVDKAGKPVDYIFLEVNHAFEEMTELNRERIIGKKVTQVLPGIEKDPADWIGVYGHVALTGEPVQFENHAEPLGKWYKVSAYCPAKGYFVALFEDITERKKAEDALHESEVKFRTVADFTYNWEYWIAPDGNLIYVSPSCKRVTGYDANEFTEDPKLLTRIVHPEDKSIVGSHFDLISSKELHVVDFRIVKRGGETRWISHSCQAVFDDNGKWIGRRASNRDISERKRTEDALQQEKEVVQQERDRLSSLLNSITDEVWFADTEKKFSLANPSAVKEFKLASSAGVVDVENLAASSEVYRSDGSPRPVEEAPPLRALKGEIVKNQEEIVRTPESGELHTRIVNSAPVRNESGNIIGSVSVVRDITERKKAEEATARQAELIDLSPDAIIVRKLDGTITFWSKGAEKLYGLTKHEAIGQDINSLLKPEFPQPLEEILNKLKLDGKWSGEIVHTCKCGDKVVVQSFWVGKIDADGKIVEMLESNVDITKRIQLQAQLEESAIRVEEYANQMEELANQRAEQLKEAERLAAIGATAGMVGHDIRNPLQAITGDVYLAKTDVTSLPESEEKNSALESLQEIEKNVDYINKIVADLQDFARPLKPNVEETDLKLVIEELLKKNGLPENVKVTVVVENDAQKVVADSTFINRILYNLVTNAVQAMSKGGKLTIHAYKKAKDVFITVKDTGVGIPESVRGKLFTPMFTTKAKGQGFGLAVIKRMTESLGGTVSFESQEGKGTTFIIRLPSARVQP